ncbi:MAG: uncharacterized protein JWM90_767 [Thermoleophilia bacterium]|nr:uncharacterized protein [Thermoleophilia bacterium]
MRRDVKRPMMRWGGPAVLTTILVSVVIPVQQFLHRVSGGHGEEHLAPLAHALRDGAALWPGLLLGLLVATRICTAILGPTTLREQIRATTTFVPVMSLAVGVTIGLGVPLHAWLFEGAGALREDTLSEWLSQMRSNGALAAAIALPTTLLLSLGARALHRLRLPALPTLVLHRRVLVVSGVAAGVAIATISLASLTDTATADLPGAPCPAGAPMKTFAISAIDVDITLNRFGDHDPEGRMYVLRDRIGDVRAAEASKQVSIGLEDDAIQPLVVRANMGDCIEVDYRNDADEPYGFHVDGLTYVADQPTELADGDPQVVPPGESRSYRFYVPDDASMEGAHYVRPGLARRGAVSHGLFGAIVVEPKGATYDNPRTGAPQLSGWDAIIDVPGRPDFREFTRLYHEIGNEEFEVLDRGGLALPEVDPITETYRPGTRAINYRSEPFMNRLEVNEHQKSLAYNSYTFGDPPTPIMRSYLGEPTKIRLLHAGSEMFHVFHLHGGGIRWRANPLSDPDWDYGDTGLDKHPQAQSQSNRTDSQSMGPGEAYNLEIEGGAGGVQQTVGDLLEHCHIAEHYNSGMWSFWRVYNTRQPDLAPLPDRTAPPASVDSTQLLGKTMPDGTVLTAANIDTWISGMLPPRGTPSNDQDATVWDWRLDRSNPARPLALGETEETDDWPNLGDGTHPGGVPGDEFVGSRPTLRFHPTDGRPAFPLLRTNIGQRAPFSPRHSGTPFLGSRVNAPKVGSVDPYAKRPDGLCPANSPLKRFDITAIATPARITRAGKTDPTAMVFARNQDKAAILAGSKAVEPLAIRSNVGDCVAVDFTTEIGDATVFGGFAKSNIHIHHLQFDIQGSDGASAGYVFDQSVRPYRIAACGSRSRPRLARRR